MDMIFAIIGIAVLVNVFTVISRLLGIKKKQGGDRWAQSFENSTKQVYEKYFKGPQNAEESDDTYQSVFDPHSEPHYVEGKQLEWGSTSATEPPLEWGSTSSFVPGEGYSGKSVINFAPMDEVATPPAASTIKLRFDEGSVINGVIMSEILRRPAGRRGYGMKRR